MIPLIIFNFIISSFLYLYLHKKTRMNIKYIFIDNIVVAISAFIITYLLLSSMFIAYLFSSLLIILFAYALTMLRFWRTPVRKITARDQDIISPADGNIIYIKRVEANEVPISIKQRSISKLSELTKTELLKTPCWLIGINMTPFDVHKNCAPIEGKVLLNLHTAGKFLSLKNPESLSVNERNTYVIANDKISIGVIQIASKRVRRIDTYVKENQIVKKGEWLGMIRFGSQVDLILPVKCKILVNVGQQVYAIKTIIAEFE